MVKGKLNYRTILINRFNIVILFKYDDIKIRLPKNKSTNSLNLINPRIQHLFCQ